jgi:hypothetical protein
MSWPWPRIIRTRHHIFVILLQPSDVLRLGITQLNAGVWEENPLADLGTPEEISFVDIADFGPFYVISTYPQQRTFVKNITIANEFESVSEISSPIVSTLCNFRGQCLCGNVSVSPTIHGVNAVLWSGIGNFEFSPEADVTAGFMRVFSERSVVHRLLPTANGVIAYCDEGTVLLTPATVGSSFTYGERLLNSLGIRSGNHVAGDERIHAFIDSRNELWTFEAPDTLTKRGYSEYIRTMLQKDERVIVSYLPIDNRFYISNSESCLVVNAFGAYYSHQLVSGIVHEHDQLYGTFADTLNEEALIVTDTLDFSSRDIKISQSIGVCAQAICGRGVYGSLGDRRLKQLYK